jgi:hypothetical protein
LSEKGEGPALGNEDRNFPRHLIHDDAVLSLIGQSHSVPCRVLDLSLGGCRLRAKELLRTRQRVSVEVTFKIRGFPMLLCGVIQWTDGVDLMGIRFVDLNSRSKEALAEVVREIEEEHAAKGVSEDSGGPAQRRAGVETPAPRGPAAMDAACDRRREPQAEADTSAVILLVGIGCQLHGQIIELSPGGCRIHIKERFPVDIDMKVETEFRLGGLPFRLGGVIQGVHDRDRHSVGIRFLHVSERKRVLVEQLMEEIEEMRARKALAKAGEPGL